MRADGALAVRATGAVDPRPGGAPGARVHLIGTAAGPLGGDDIDIDVAVEAGATLALRGVAATLALPHRDGGRSHVHLRVHVAEDARCDVALEPVVVAGGADVHVLTDIDITGSSSLDLVEQVVLGRWGEAPGAWRGTLHAGLGGRPWLRQSVALGPGAPAWDALSAPRALVSRLRTASEVDDAAQRPAGVTAGDAVLLPLARGGSLLEAYGGDLASALADAARADAALAEAAR